MSIKKLQVLNYQFKPSDGIVRIVPLGCLHFGHKNFNSTKAKGFRDYIINTPDTYTMMLGDTLENVLAETAVRHPGSMHEQEEGVEQQRETAYKFLTPLAASGKILGWHEGNHSLRSWYAAGFSVEKYLADKLNIPFLGTDGLFKIGVGRQSYVIHATHGTGSSTTLPSVFGKLLAQMARVEGADVYLRSHHHKKVLADVMTLHGPTGKLRKKVIGATGCFMDYFDSYGHRAGYTPTVLGCIKIKLYAERWDIHATL